MVEERKIGLIEGVMIGIGGTIGPSMFVILGFAAGMAHQYVYLSLIIAGLLSLTIALNYAELATTFPEMGGGYFYVKEGFGGFISYFTGMSLFIGYITYGAICAIGFSLLLYVFVPINPLITSTILVFLFLAVNIRGIEESMKMQFVITSILLFSFGLIIFCGFLGTSNLTYKGDIGSNLGGVLRASAFLSIAYFGFEPIGVLAGAVKRPGKVIPLSIISSITICITLYSLIAFVSTKYVPWNILYTSPTPLTLVASRILGRFGTIMITIAGMAATLTSLNVSISSGAYVFYSMAKDHYLPDTFSKLHPKYNTPVSSLIAVAFIMELFILSGMIEYITHLADFSLLVALSIVNLSTIALRKKRKGVVRPFKVPFFPWLSIMASILTLFLAFMLELSAIILWLGMLLALAMIYLLNTLTTERGECALSGFLISTSVLLFLILQQFRLTTSLEPLSIIVGMIETFLLIQAIIVFVVSIIIIYPIQILVTKIRGRGEEYVYVPPKRLIEVSEAVDDALAVVLFIFGCLNMMLFYGILHGTVTIIANTTVEVMFFKTFFMTILVISGIFEILIGIFLVQREYVLEFGVIEEKKESQ